MPDYPTATGCTEVTVTDLTGAEIPACTVQPQTFEDTGALVIGDRPPAPEGQLIGPPCGFWWY